MAQRCGRLCICLYLVYYYFLSRDYILYYTILNMLYLKINKLYYYVYYSSAWAKEVLVGSVPWYHKLVICVCVCVCVCMVRFSIFALFYYLDMMYANCYALQKVKVLIKG